MGAACSTIGTASEVCASLTLNGYSDWFLPSKDELIALYQSRAQVNTTAMNNGGYSFDVNWFYSASTETAAHTAFIKRFDASGAEGSSNKGTGYRIRAIRAF